MIYIAGGISPLVQFVYTVVLIAEIYTTAVGSLYGFTSRLAEFKKLSGKWVVIGATLIALVASRFGFSNLVKYLYPAVGYGGIILLVSLALIEFRRKRPAGKGMTKSAKPDRVNSSPR
jgi:uncharacterized membrane protein YkvI